MKALLATAAMGLNSRNSLQGRHEERGFALGDICCGPKTPLQEPSPVDACQKRDPAESSLLLLHPPPQIAAKQKP